jgi:hypothetical protein
MIVSANDFVFPYVIPNKDRLLTQLNNFIAVEEEKYLIKVLSYNGYKAFVLNQTAPKWVDFKDGKDYQVDGVWHRYEGAKSFVLPYLYQLWIRTNILSNFVGTGHARTETENAEIVSSSYTCAQYYNEATDKVKSFYKFIEAVGSYDEVKQSEFGYVNNLSI